MLQEGSSESAVDGDEVAVEGALSLPFVLLPLPRPRPPPASSSPPSSPPFFLAADANGEAWKLRRGQLLLQPRCIWKKVGVEVEAAAAAAAAAAVDVDGDDDDDEEAAAKLLRRSPASLDAIHACSNADADAAAAILEAIAERNELLERAAAAAASIRKGKRKLADRKKGEPLLFLVPFPVAKTKASCVSSADWFSHRKWPFEELSCERARERTNVFPPGPSARFWRKHRAEFWKQHRSKSASQLRRRRKPKNPLHLRSFPLSLPLFPAPSPSPDLESK